MLLIISKYHTKDLSALIARKKNLVNDERAAHRASGVGEHVSEFEGLEIKDQLPKDQRSTHPTELSSRPNCAVSEGP